MNKLFLGLAAVFFFCGFACNQSSTNAQEERGMSTQSDKIRPAVFAAQGWYDSNPDRLRKTIDLFMRHAKVYRDLGKIVGLISPHAGYRFSGPVAAYAYKQVLGKEYDTVVVVAPNHRNPRLDFSSVLTEGGYETPLGIVYVDVETAKAVADYDGFDDVRASELGHLDGGSGGMEHSLEIQLPFLQVALGDFKLVPIVMGNQTRKSCEALARAIVSAVKDKNALLVASSDLSHFFTAEKAKELDGIVRKHVEDFDPEGLLQDIAMDRCQACGGGPIAAVMMACRDLGAGKATVLNMATSGDVTGDNSSVVGYMAACLSIPGKGGEQDETEVGVDLGLTEQEKQVLKNVVRQTLEAVVNGGETPRFNNFNGKLGEKWGAFVTLTKHGKLRGCIGHIVGTQPLITTVAEMARAAALEDYRFPKVKPSELPDIEFEISVLTPLREIKDIEEIVVGRDGIFITKGMRRGVLLPQVATEYGWDRITFLEQTCLKAGLPPDAWKDADTKIEIFSAEIIK